MTLRQSHSAPINLLASLALLIVAASTSPARATFPIMGFDSLLSQIGNGRETFGAMGNFPRVGSGGVGVPGVLFNDAFNSFEVDAQVIDLPGDPLDQTAFGAVGFFYRGTDPFGVNFDPSQYQLAVTFKPGANNAGTQFDIAIDQHDGFADSPGTTTNQGEQFRWEFTDIVNRYNTAVGLGQADANGFVTLTRDITQLPNPRTGSPTQPWDAMIDISTGFAAPGDDLLDFDAIQSGARNGAHRIQLRSVENAADRLNLKIKSVKLLPKTPVPEIIRVDGKTAYTSTFLSAQAVGAVNRTGPNLVLDMTDNGGVQLYQTVSSFDGTQYGVEVTAKLLANNTAANLRIVGRDLDGTDAAPGAEDWAVAFPTSGFNSSTFTTVTLPWSQASRIAATSFGFANAGDNSIANFDLFQLQVTCPPGDLRLNVEIQSAKIVPLAPPGLAGDFNSDNRVDGHDFLLWQRGGSPNGMTQGDLTIWNDNFGAPAQAAASVVPEPGSIGLLAFVFIAAIRSRRTPRLVA